jgi:exodeoxyribonuclease V alpha subunit
VYSNKEDKVMATSKVMQMLLDKVRADREAKLKAPIIEPIIEPAKPILETIVETAKPPLTMAERFAAIKAKSAKPVSTGIQGHKATSVIVDDIIEQPISHIEPEGKSPLTELATLPIKDTTGMHGEAITYNSQQATFIDLASSGKSCVLVGAAGTGKTTCSQGAISKLITSGKVSIPTLQADGHKHLKDGGPGILIISYTRRAVNNIAKVQSSDMKNNCITSHKLLEYAPEYYDIEDIHTGLAKRTMQFVPQRNAAFPLPNSIHTIIVEEASMLSTELFVNIEAALAHEVQWIFIGDIQQLPPVFGSAILGFKMLELPVVELTEVYRQALESPIIRLAHRILSGKAINVSEYPEWAVENKLTIHPWKKKLSAENAVLTLGAFFKQAIDKEVYDIHEDMILIPYNKSCGTIELNKIIANHLARKQGERTFEVMAGFNKHYFTVHDKVLYDREDAEIIHIEPNAVYSGARVQPPSIHLDYWGHNPNIANESSSHNFEDDIDLLLASAADDTEDRVTQSSHIIHVRLLDSGREIPVNKAADVNNLLLSYALTVHKSQGSEWRKVFVCLHQSHNSMLQRELLYTAVTRAREELYVICEPESFTKGIITQRIKGETLEEKATFFKGKLDPNITNDRGY